jgi:hypothetical protein
MCVLEAEKAREWELVRDLERVLERLMVIEEKMQRRVSERCKEGTIV